MGKVKEYAAILLIIGFLAYLPSLFGQFVWDDEDFVYANAYVKESRIDRFFTENAVAGRGKSSNYYRPIQFSLYSLIYRLAGPSPWAFHLAGILLHLAAASLVFLTLACFMTPFPAFLASLLFLIHPVQTESVSYISGLSDQLYSCFFFGALLAFLKRKQPGWSAAVSLSLLLFVLSMLSKELGIILPGIIFFIILFKTRSLKKDTAVLTAFFGLAAFYLILRFTVLKFTDVSVAWQGQAYGAHFMTRLATFFHNFFIFLSLLIFPVSLHMERDLTTPVLTNIFNVWTLLFMAVNVCIILLLWSKRSKDGFRIALLFYILFVASLVPYTGVFLLNGILYEHYLYLPMAFFFAFAVALISPLLRHKATLAVIAVVSCLFIIRSYARQWDWIDNERFYRQTLSFAPQSIRILNGLGMTLAEKNECPEALLYYQKALKLSSAVPNLYHNIANCYREMGRYDDAEIGYHKALKVNPDFQYSTLSLLQLYLTTGQKQKAKALLEQELLPRYPDNGQLRAIYSQL